MSAGTTVPKGFITLKTALKAMAAKARLMAMSDPKAPDGKSYYVVPGGKITKEVATALWKRPDVFGSKDGLFPGHDQTWRMGDAA